MFNRRYRAYVTALLAALFLVLCAGEVFCGEENSPAYNTSQSNSDRWQSFTEEQRQVLRERAYRLSPDQIDNLKKNERSFKALPLSEQQRISENYNQFKAADHREQSVLLERYRKFKKLPANQRNEIRQRVQSYLDKQGGHPRGRNGTGSNVRRNSASLLGVGPKGAPFRKKAPALKTTEVLGVLNPEDTEDIKVRSADTPKALSGNENFKK